MLFHLHHAVQGLFLGEARRKFPALLGWFLLFAGAGLGAEPARAPSASETNALDYMIVVTGEELLRGAYPDAHTCFLTRALHMLGCHCVGSLTVDDRAEDIREAVRFATNKVRLVIVTGGLGPTVNDVTRGALAEFTGIRLAEHPEALAELERRFKQPRDQLRANLRRQTLVPTRGTYLKNANGTAVGLVFEPDGAVVVALPGPPRELQPMVNNELVPYLRRKFGVRGTGTSLTVRFVGVGQSQIDQAIHDHVPLAPDVVVGSLFEGSRVDFIFALPGHAAEDLARLKEIEAKLREHLGEYFYADDGSSLEELVVKSLRARGQSLVLVEVGSGGHLAASVDGVKEIDQVLHAAYMAPTEDRMRPMLEIPTDAWAAGKAGPERIKTLGAAAQKLTGSTFAIVVGQVAREEDGKAFVWVAFGSAPDRWETQRVPVQGTGEMAHANLVTQILDRLRRHLK